MDSYCILIFTRISLVYDIVPFERKDSLFSSYFELLYFISIEFKLQINIAIVNQFLCRKKIYLNIFYNLLMACIILQISYF